MWIHILLDTFILLSLSLSVALIYWNKCQREFLSHLTASAYNDVNKLSYACESNVQFSSFFLSILWEPTKWIRCDIYIYKYVQVFQLQMFGTNRRIWPQQQQQQLGILFNSRTIVKWYIVWTRAIIEWMFKMINVGDNSK